MLTKDDLEQFREVVRDEVSTRILESEQRLEERLTTKLDDRFARSEQRLEERLGSRLEERLSIRLEERLSTRLEERLSTRFAEQLGEFIENNINPQFEELRREIQFIRSHMITRFDLEDRLVDFRLSFKGVV